LASYRSTSSLAAARRRSAAKQAGRATADHGDPTGHCGITADIEQLDIEHQRRAGRNRADPAVAVAVVRRINDQRALAADLHAGHAFIPAADDLAGAEREGERFAAADELSKVLPCLVSARLS
jgi:hypothetical protein